MKFEFVVKNNQVEEAKTTVEFALRQEGEGIVLMAKNNTGSSQMIARIKSYGVLQLIELNPTIAAQKLGLQLSEDNRIKTEHPR